MSSTCIMRLLTKVFTNIEQVCGLGALKLGIHFLFHKRSALCRKISKINHTDGCLVSLHSIRTEAILLVITGHEHSLTAPSHLVLCISRQGRQLNQWLEEGRQLLLSSQGWHLLIWYGSCVVNFSSKSGIRTTLALLHCKSTGLLYSTG